MQQWQIEAQERQRRLDRLDGKPVRVTRQVSAPVVDNPWRGVPVSRTQAVKAQANTRAAQLDGIGAKERTLRTLLDGLRSGRLDAGDLGDTRCVEGMMCRSAGRTPDEVRRMVGSTAPKRTRADAAPQFGRATDRRYDLETR